MPVSHARAIRLIHAGYMIPSRRQDIVELNPRVGWALVALFVGKWGAESKKCSLGRRALG